LTAILRDEQVQNVFH
jgi:hypothetical protein